MTDLLHVLPNFPTGAYTHLLPSLEKNLITTSDLLTLDALDIAKRAQLPILDIRRLVGHIVDNLRQDLNIVIPEYQATDDIVPKDGESRPGHKGGKVGSLTERNTISFLDPVLDNALRGGISTGYVTEITGESGVGKTQFLLTLLLSVQLPPPQGLGRSSIYISSEAPLSTKRLAQILQCSEALSSLTEGKPKLQDVRSVPCGDLETQDHILEYQLPVAVDEYNVGLVVLDSVAANYRAEQASSVPKDLADRARRLAKLGHLLRRLAVEKDIAVVVANQVSDRLDSNIIRNPHMSSSQIQSSSPLPSSPATLLSQQAAIEDPILSLDHQQRFFTGWGDETTWTPSMKTPALGLGWSNQVSCRIALKMDRKQNHEPLVLADPNGEMVGGNIWSDTKSQRYMKVVFAPWAPRSEGPDGVTYEITMEGIRGVGNR